MSRNIQFSPPDITQSEIDEVVDTLRSGWITTGPKTKRFEKEISDYCGSSRTACLNSATAGMELLLRLFDIGPGDEVITSAYTYTASASVIIHCGAKPVLVDIQPGGFNIDPKCIAGAITERTKAIIAVDIGGMPADYDDIFKVVEINKNIFKPSTGTLQEQLGRIVVIADGADSFGAKYDGRMSGNVADFTAFSFHAVKNLTTAEGGAVTWKNNPCFIDQNIYQKMMLMSLHGQTKDALAKTKAGAWEYDISIAGWKYNMADLNAAIGLAQLKRYNTEILPKRKEITEKYLRILTPHKQFILPKFKLKDRESSYHLFQLRIANLNVEKRNELINRLISKGVPTNVHYKPLPLFKVYSEFGYHLDDYPVAMACYSNEITLPLHTQLSAEDVDYIANNLLEEVLEIS